MKNKSLLLVLIGLVALFLVACSGDGDSTDSDASDVKTVGEDLEDATELSFWTFSETHSEFFIDAAENWNEEHPDKTIKLNAEVYPFDSMHNNLLLALQSGEGAPDIADIELTRFPNFMQGEPQLLSMNEYIEPELENFVEARFEIYSKDGTYYGLPTHVGAAVMYYNTEILDAAGVNPDDIQTWDDFIESGKQVVQNTDALMTNTFPGDLSPYNHMVSQQGSDFVDDEGNITLNAEENIRALELLKQMQDEGIAEIAPGGQPHAEEFYGYMNDGGAAAISMPIWYMSSMTGNMPDLKGKMIIRPMPAFEEGGDRSAGIGGTGTVVTNTTEHGELAKEFLAYAKLSKEANIKLWTLLGFDPPRHDIWDDPAMLEDNEYYQYFGDDIFETLEDVRDEINAMNTTEDTPNISSEITTNTLNRVLREESHTAEEALNQSQEALE